MLNYTCPQGQRHKAILFVANSTGWKIPPPNELPASHARLTYKCQAPSPNANAPAERENSRCSKLRVRVKKLSKVDPVEKTHTKGETKAQAGEKQQQ